MSNEYLEQVMVEAYDRGEVFLGGYPPVRVVTLRKKLDHEGNVEMRMVKETEGGKPQFFLVEMTFGEGGRPKLKEARLADDSEGREWLIDRPYSISRREEKRC